MMEKIGRERRSESVWREIVGRQAESGLTVQDFCEREGIKSASLYGWRSRLRADVQNRSVPRRISRARQPEKPAGEFIDLGALGSEGSRFEVRLDLGGGVLLHLVRS
jgi:putative transposase